MRRGSGANGQLVARDPVEENLKMLKKVLWTSAAVAIALATACGDKSSGPVSPTSTPVADSAAGASGETLKVNAPTPESPANGSTVDDFAPTLVVANAAGKFVAAQLDYQFQVADPAGNVIETTGPLPAGNGRTSHIVTAKLETNTIYTWHARARQGLNVGPWSTSTFKTPDRPEGYIRGNEVYDPLIDGKTVGHIVGSVSFIPGVGVRLNSFTSHIRYELPQTLTAGEFSLLITDMPTNTAGSKTKVFGMSEGFADIITNDRRFTVDKRANGTVAWRFITHDDQIDTGGGERRIVHFNGGQVYLFRATWNGRFDLRIQEGGVGGRTIYSFGKPYAGVYDPTPHFAYIGVPVGRSGPDSATVPGMVVRQVWLSSRPRPSYANK
jgi:hypothetical protein